MSEKSSCSQAALLSQSVLALRARLAPYDMLLCQTEIDAMKGDPGWKGGNYDSDPSASLVAKVSRLTLSTPANVNHTYSREGMLEFPSAEAGRILPNATTQQRN